MPPEELFENGVYTMSVYCAKLVNFEYKGEYLIQSDGMYESEIFSPPISLSEAIMLERKLKQKFDTHMVYLKVIDDIWSGVCVAYTKDNDLKSGFIKEPRFKGSLTKVNGKIITLNQD